jgi:hypothetical protein
MKWISLVAISVAIGLFPSTYFGSAQDFGALGKKTCARCHATQEKTLAGTPHDSAHACEACHGNATRHLANPSDPSSVFSYEKASPEEVRGRCRGCHSNTIMQRHAEGDVSCVSCHSSHHYVRKKYLLKADDALVHEASLQDVLPKRSSRAAF